APRPETGGPVPLAPAPPAVLAFAAGSMHVHEPILIATESGEDFAVPVVCLLEAVRRDASVDLHELMNHHQLQVVRLSPADEVLLQDYTIYYDGRQDLAAAAVLSIRNDLCTVLTGEPDAYLVGGKRHLFI